MVLTTIEAEVFNGQFCNQIQPEVEKILKIN